MFGIEGRCACRGLIYSRGKHTRRVSRSGQGKKFITIAPAGAERGGDHDFGVFKVVSQFLLNFLNTIHSFVKSYGIAILVLTLVVRWCCGRSQTKANQTNGARLRCLDENAGAA